MATLGGPASLLVGTEVSAKYKGAFCEAKVRKVEKVVKCKVTLKETQAQFAVGDDGIKGDIKVGAGVEAKDPDSGQYKEATINKITDSSVYTVEFDDGDVATLRRTQLVLKGEKHYNESATLDQLPLTHPEHFGTPVVNLKKEQRRSKASPINLSNLDFQASSDEEMPPQRQRRGRGQAPPAPPKPAPPGLTFAVGSVLSVEGTGKHRWYPALVVRPPSSADAMPGHVAVKSFRDNKILPVPKEDVKEFSKDLSSKQDDKKLKMAIEMAVIYKESGDLPQGWDKDQLLVGSEDSASDHSDPEEDQALAESAFMFKYTDFVNAAKGPGSAKTSITLNHKPVSIYRLYKVLTQMGGGAKITAAGKWKEVCGKFGCSPGSSHSAQMKTFYKKHLEAFEEAQKKGGVDSGVGGAALTRGMRVRSDSARGSLSVAGLRSSPSPSAKAKTGSGKPFPGTRGAERRGRTMTAPETKGEDGKRSLGARQKAQDEAASGGPPRKRRRVGTDDSSVRTASVPARYRQVDSPGGKTDGPPVPVPAALKARGRSSRTIIPKEEGVAPKRKIKEDPHTAKGVSPKKSLTRRSSVRGAEEVVKVKQEPADSSVGDEDEQSSLDSSGAGQSAVSCSSSAASSANPAAPAYVCEVPYPPDTTVLVAYGGEGVTNPKKQYRAHVKEVDEDRETGALVYLVHYIGWNTRHDEWITTSRIMGQEGKPQPKRMELPRTYVSPGANNQSYSLKRKPLLGRSPLTKSVQEPKSPGSGNGSNGSAAGAGPVESPGSTPAPTAAQPSARPTRSNSVEVNLCGGLPAAMRKKERQRTLSGMDQDRHDPGSEGEGPSKELPCKTGQGTDFTVTGDKKLENDASPSGRSEPDRGTAPMSSVLNLHPANTAREPSKASPSRALKDNLNVAPPAKPKDATVKSKETKDLAGGAKESKVKDASPVSRSGELLTKSKESGPVSSKSTNAVIRALDDNKQRSVSPASHKPPTTPSRGSLEEGRAACVANEAAGDASGNVVSPVSDSGRDKGTSGKDQEVNSTASSLKKSSAQPDGGKATKAAPKPKKKERLAQNQQVGKSQSKDRISLPKPGEKGPKANKAVSLSREKLPAVVGGKEKPSGRERAGSPKGLLLNKAPSPICMANNKTPLEPDDARESKGGAPGSESMATNSNVASPCASRSQTAIRNDKADLPRVAKTKSIPTPMDIANEELAEEPKDETKSDQSITVTAAVPFPGPPPLAPGHSEPTVDGSSKVKVTDADKKGGEVTAEPMDLGLPPSASAVQESGLAPDKPTGPQPSVSATSAVSESAVELDNKEDGGAEPVAKGARRVSKKGKKGKAISLKTSPDNGSGDGATPPAGSPVGAVGGRPALNKRPSMDSYKPAKRPRYIFNLKDDVDKIDDEDSRIEYLEEKIVEIRKLWAEKKGELAEIDKKRKRIKRRERDQNAAQNAAGDN